jgi:hypothetical protein
MKTYLPSVLNPLADTLVDEANQARRTIDEAVIDEIAVKLYRRHRSEASRAKVRERTWETIPNSERGKYRRIVREAIERYGQ